MARLSSPHLKTEFLFVFQAAQASQFADCGFIAFGYVSALVRNPTTLPFRDVHPMNSHRMRALRVSLLSRVGQMMDSELDGISWSPPADRSGNDPAPLEPHAASNTAATSRETAPSESPKVGTSSSSRLPNYESDGQSSGAGPSYSMEQSQSSPGPSTFAMELDTSEGLYLYPDPDSSPTPSPSVTAPESSSRAGPATAALTSSSRAAGQPPLSTESPQADARAASTLPNPESLDQPPLGPSGTLSPQRTSPDASTSAMDVDAPGYTCPASSPTLSLKSETHGDKGPNPPGATGAAPPEPSPSDTNTTSTTAPSASLGQQPPGAASSTSQETDLQELINADFPKEVDKGVLNAVNKLLFRKQPMDVIMRVTGAAKGDGTPLTRESLLSLVQFGNWINDEVLNAWRALLKLDMQARGLSDKICLMNTQFSMKLQNPREVNVQDLSRWIAKVRFSRISSRFARSLTRIS